MDLGLVIFLICLGISSEAFFAGTELAFISLNKFLLKNKADAGHTGATKVVDILKKPSEMLVTTLCGIHLSIVSVTTLATIYTIKTYGEEKTYYASLILSPFILILGELIPKKMAVKYANQLVTKLAHPLKIITYLFMPITFLLIKYSNLTTKLLGIKENSNQFVPTRQDLRILINTMDITSDVKEHEKEMIDNMLYLPEAIVEDAMVPLSMIDALPDDSTLDDAIELICEKGHSRIPVYSERIDNIIGIVFSYNILENYDKKKKISEIMTEPLYVSHVQPLDETFRQLKKERQHMCVVVDEFGAAIGLITMEDIIEEVVGDIDDEFDEEIGSKIKQISSSVYVVSASIEIDDINQKDKIEIPDGEYFTLGGYLLELFEKIPVEGEKIEDENNTYIVSKASNRKIEEIIIKIKDKTK